MRIQNNIAAFNASRNLGLSNASMGKSLEKLSSGFRINRAADDAAGLVISQQLRAQSSGLQQATRNAQDGISVVQIAEGALTEVHSMLNRMRDLAVQAANTGSVGTDALAAIEAEFAELASEIEEIEGRTKFGDVELFGADLVFQVGANDGDTLDIEIGDFAAFGVPATAAAGIQGIDDAINAVSELRGELGAKQNRLESIINNLQVAAENVTASESRIRDTDMAAEMTNFTKNQILQQAGTAMLGQANSLPQSVLRLLG